MSMVITRRQKIDTIIDRWTEQYPDSNHEKTKKLRDLKNKTKESIAGIIGNSSWTSNNCDQCDNDCEKLYHFGAPFDYCSSTALICAECIKESIKEMTI